MPASRTRLRARLSALVSLALAATGSQVFLATPAAEAAGSTGLVINEVYVNGGSTGATYRNKFVELHNPTASEITFTGSLQYRSYSGTGISSGRTDLTAITVPAGGYWLVSGNANSTNGQELPTPDTAGTIAFSGNTNGGTIWLTTSTGAANPDSDPGLVDKIGYGASNSPEGTAEASGYSVTSSLTRTGGVDTDVNSADFTSSTPPTPTACDCGDASEVTVAAIGAKSGTVGQEITTFTLSATGGTPGYTWSATGLPPGVTIDPPTGTVSGTPTEAGTFEVVVTASDSAAPTPATDTETFAFTVAGPAQERTIAEVQGTGAATPYAGDVVVVAGEVTAVYATRGLNGFYVQTPGADTVGASDAIFVFAGSGSAFPAIGDSVEVTGTATEFFDQTQISITNGTVSQIADLPGSVTPKTAVPGAGCAVGGCETLAALAAAREAMEGELLQPTAPWTVTDVYDFSPYWPGVRPNGGHYGEIGLAAESDEPLVTPTEVVDAQATALRNARIAYNDAHRIILDDGSSLNFTLAANQDTPFPWLTQDHSVRVGAGVTFPEPVVFTWSQNTWRIIPTTPVVGAPTATQPQFEQTRAQNLAPQEVGGDLRLATFNILNFFPTTGVEYVASGLGLCTYYEDRDDNLITTDDCGSPTTSSGNGPRGAADEENLARQRAKIVAAINISGAHIVSLEELENSVKFGKDRDFAIGELVEALNAAAGAGTWAYAPSPAAAELPPLAEQDVIRNGFIYRPAAVALVGPSVVLADQSSEGEAFEDAREPVAQAFKAVGGEGADAFAVIVNHFKSKRSGTPDPDGQGNGNDQRIQQATALAAFADSFQTLRGITRVFLAGDFNAYTEEDPIQVLEAAGYAPLESTSDPDEESYNFDGQVGSLDHVLANQAAAADVTGVDIWEINANESVYYEYGRYNYNVTNLYSPGPFRSSDHNPEVVGIDVPDAPPAVAASTTRATVHPRKPKVGHQVRLKVAVRSANGAAVTGQVQVTVGGETRTATLTDGRVVLSLGRPGTPGVRTVTVSYLGSDLVAASSDTVEFTVRTKHTRK